MTRGRCGSLRLHRKGLAPSTPCRSPGALANDPTRTLRDVRVESVMRLAAWQCSRRCRNGALHSRVESASEAERRERFGFLAGHISLVPNGTLDGFNRFLAF